jgi:hypothetical protein
MPVGVLLVPALLALALPLLGVPAHAAATYAFAPSGLDGAGFQNVVAYSPFLDGDGRRPILLGADVAGVHRSVDGGRTWSPARAGLSDPHVASLLFSRSIPGTVWAATDSALHVSTDFGRSWRELPGRVDFDANGRYRLDNREHPRATGTLLAEDTSGPVSYLYAATATQGVKRSSDGGETWAAVALAGHRLRSIALDPEHPDVLYVGDVTGGLQVSRNARTGFGFSPVPGGPAVSEELAFVGSTLYVAGGAAGVFAYDGTWHDLGVPTGGIWQSVTGYVDDGGATVLLVGCAQPVGGNHTLRSTDGGATWTSIASGTAVTVHPEEFGSSTPWGAADKPYLDTDGRNFVASGLAVDPDDRGTLLLAGRGGAYVATIGPSGVDWWPSMRGLMATVNMVVVADPRLPGRVHVGNMDWTYIPSGNNGVTVVGGAVPAGAPTTGDVVALDVSGPRGVPSPVYLGASNRGQNAGGSAVWSNPDPLTTPTAWTDERLPVTNDVVALGVGRSASGSRVILASVTSRGLYRKDGSTWTRVSGTAPFGSGGTGTFAWVPGTPVVYAMDGGGTWRSTAAGAPGSWTRIAGGSSAYGNVNSLALDPLRPGVLYAADDALGGVVRITGADSAVPVRSTVLPLARPGPIAVTPTGGLLAHDAATGALLLAPDPGAASPVFTDVSDEFYRTTNRSIRSLAVGPDGYVYTASNSSGVTIAPPLEPVAVDVTPPSVPSELTSPAQGMGSVTLAWSASTDDTAVTAYQVLRNGAVVATVTTPGWTDTGLPPATTVGYRVRALDAWGNTSDLTSELTMTVPGDGSPPSVPGALRARVVSATQVALSWQASTDDVGVVGYRVIRDGQALRAVTGLTATDTTTAGTRTYQVAAVDAAGNASQPTAAAVVLVPAAAPAGLTGTYFDTVSFTAPTTTRIDPRIDFGWGTGRPATGVAPDTFSVRWTGRVVVPAEGTWTFVTRSDDGVRLWIDDRLVVSNWTTHLLTENRGTVTLTADRAHDIRLEYFDQTGAATARLLWSGPGVSQRVVPASALLAR